MNNLFSAGFHLSEIVGFLERSGTAEPGFVATMRAGLERGDSLAEILRQLHFSSRVTTQIALAEAHGNLGETLTLVEKNLRAIAAVRKKLATVGTYPLMLLAFLVLIMLGMKNYLLPQVSGNGRNFATDAIEHLPSIFLAIFVALLVLSAFVALQAKRQSAVSWYRRLARLPFIGRLVQSYLTAYFAREWGLLLSQGLDFRQVLALMSGASSRIFREVGQRMADGMQAGRDFHQEVRQFSFFTPELALMIEYGELRARLGVELALYSEESWENFFARCERAMGLIQPLVFLFVALMIVLIYAAMLLPIYSNMNTF